MSTEIKPSSERRCTNIPALVIAIVFLSITLLLVTICGVTTFTQYENELDFFNSTDSDVLKDSCGNICGQNNVNSSNSKCGSSDKREKPKLLINTFDGDITSKDDDYPEMADELNQCVSVCPEDHTEISNRCVHSFDRELQEMLNTLKSTWYHIIAICFVAFFFSYIFLILFRYAAKYVIWIINIGFVVLVLFIALLSAIAGSIEGMIVFGVIAIIMIIFLVYFRSRIAVVAKLFKEASRALIDVTALMFEPILTFISLLISFLIFGTFFAIISFVDEENPVVGPAHLFNLISFIFITQFIIGCQNFIIAGTICRWYFTRDKTKLRKPIKKSFSHLFKFHLGSVCFGAILITIVKILRMIARSAKNSARENKNVVAALIAVCLLCLLDMLEQVLAYLVRNAYIIVAKEGTPFYDSGKRASRLLMDNISDVIALNHFGDLVLFVCRLLILLTAGFVGYAILKKDDAGSDITIPLILGCILAFLIAHCFVMVFEMTVDTIFVSFCIDLEENDGDTKPYYMSESLKRIIMDMKEQSGGTLAFGPKTGPGIEGGLLDGSGIPMLPPQQPYPQPMHPNSGYGDPNNPMQYPPQPFPQQPYPQQPMYPPQPNMPYPPQPGMPYQPQAGVSYPEKPLLPPQGYPTQYPDQKYPEKY